MKSLDNWLCYSIQWRGQTDRQTDRQTYRQTDRQTDKNYKDPTSYVGGGPKNVEACCLSIMHNIWLSKLSKNKLLKVSWIFLRNMTAPVKWVYKSCHISLCLEAPDHLLCVSKTRSQEIALWVCSLIRLNPACSFIEIS